MYNVVTIISNECIYFQHPYYMQQGNTVQMTGTTGRFSLEYKNHVPEAIFFLFFVCFYNFLHEQSFPFFSFV